MLLAKEQEGLFQVRFPQGEAGLIRHLAPAPSLPPGDGEAQGDPVPADTD